jgi:superfamily I DNA/RNA helicase/RecB family exonuclease
VSYPGASIGFVTDPQQFEPDLGQARVIDHGRGALLVTGDAGTGKTAALEERFARLLESGRDPERVVLVVGSARARDRARRRMLRRVSTSLPVLRVVTIHGLAYQVLLQRYGSLGYDEMPELLQASDHFGLVHQLLGGEDPADWPAYGSMLGLRGFADQVRQLLTRAQESRLAPEDMAKKAENAGLSGWSELAGFYRRYLDQLHLEGRVDFAGLVGDAATVAGDGDPPFEDVLVDDYQDTTLAAEALLLGLRPASLVVAGDPAAHVFSFQGTTSLPIESFPERIPSAETVRLEVRHRGASPTLEAWVAPHSSEEFGAIAHELRRLHVHDEVPWARLAVVVRRQGPRLSGLLRALDDAGVPRWMPESGVGLAGEPAVVPFVMALRWLARPKERDGLVEAMLTSELARLSPAVVRGLLRSVRALGLPAEAALTCRDNLGTEECEALDALVATLADAETAVSKSVSKAFEILWQRLAYSRRLVEGAQASEESRRDLDAVVAFGAAVARAGERADATTAAFLEWLEAGEEGPGADFLAGWEPEGVRVLTAHGSVGLEFDSVFVAGVVEGDFPSLTRPEPMFDLAILDRRITQSERNRLRLEDERRLFRTVVGRAGRRVVCAASGWQDDADGVGSARSRFVDELGVGWQSAPSARVAPPLSLDEAAVSFRRTLADAAAPAALRLAALDGLLALHDDPGAWWFQRGWTDTGRALHDALRVSYSRLDTLENCELQFVLNEELGLGRPSGYHAWVGHLVHTLIDEYEAGTIPQTLAAMIAAAEIRWRQEEFPSFAVSEAFRRLVTRTMLPNWFEEYAGKPSLEHEKRFEFETAGAVVTGFIDRIGGITAGGFRITDYKTGKVENAGNPAENLQLGIYALAVDEVEELAAFRPVRGVELAFLRGKRAEGDRVERVQFMPNSGNASKYREEMRARLGGLIGRVRELYEEETFRPNTQADCHWCDFKTLCPLWPQGAPLFPELEVQPR